MAGSAIGGVDFSDLPARLDAVTQRFLDGKITLSLGERQWTAKRREVGLVVDRQRALQEIESAGKSGQPFHDLLTRLSAWRGKVEIALPLDVDRQKALEFLTNLKDDVDRAPVDARLERRAPR